MKNLLLDPNPPSEKASAGDGSVLTAAPTDWRGSLPEDLRNHPTLASFKDPGALAKSYVHAQSMIGADKAVLPGEKSTPEDWNGFWDKLGRPKDAAAYGPPKDLKVSFKPDDAALNEARKVFHSQGLTAKQGEAILGHYFTMMDKTSADFQQKLGSSLKETTEALAKEYPNNLQQKLDSAKAALQKFGGNELIQYLDQSGLGNNVHLIKAFAQIGDAIAEGTGTGKGTDNPGFIDEHQAKREIEKLTQDKEFLKDFNSGNKNDPGHMLAVKKWQELHRLAYPGGN